MGEIPKMKLLLIIYDVDFDEDVMETLNHCRVTGYTQWDRVLGKGKNSDPKLDTPVWPGFNRAVAVAVEEEIEDTVMKAVQKLSDRLGGSGFKVFELPVIRVV